MSSKVETFLFVITSTALLVVAVGASTGVQSTPLYTYRMEQASFRMKFLPAEPSSFTYSTENECTLNLQINGCCSQSVPLKPTFATCEETCNTCWNTCDTCETCENTCMATCPWPTCYTCDTCWIC